MNADFSFTEDDLKAGSGDELTTDESGGPRSTLARDVDISGSLTVRYGIDVAGHYSGQLRSNSFINLTETGHAEGELDAYHVCIEGRVDGTLTARKKLEILGGGTFVGELSSQPERIVLSEFSKFGKDEDVAEEFFREYVRKPKEGPADTSG